MAARPETAARPAQGKEEPRVRTIKKNATPGVAWKVRADHAQTSQRRARPKFSTVAEQCGRSRSKIARIYGENVGSAIRS